MNAAKKPVIAPAWPGTRGRASVAILACQGCRGKHANPAGHACMVLNQERMRRRVHAAASAGHTAGCTHTHAAADTRRQSTRRLHIGRMLGRSVVSERRAGLARLVEIECGERPHAAVRVGGQPALGPAKGAEQRCAEEHLADQRRRNALRRAVTGQHSLSQGLALGSSAGIACKSSSTTCLC